MREVNEKHSDLMVGLWDKLKQLKGKGYKRPLQTHRVVNVSQTSKTDWWMFDFFKKDCGKLNTFVFPTEYLN